MYIILSQRKDIEMSYSDALYSVYHYPAKYKNQIHEGDVFVYYQGDRTNKEHRVYFGTGTIGNIHTNDGKGNDHQPIYLNDSNWNKVVKGIVFLINNNYQYNIVYEYDLYACHGETKVDKVKDYLSSIDLVSEHYN